MLLLSVKYTARPGGGEKFVREITDSGILDAVRAEDGCISYDYYFSAESPDTVLLIENGLRPSSRKRTEGLLHGFTHIAQTVFSMSL